MAPRGFQARLRQVMTVRSGILKEIIRNKRRELRTLSEGTSLKALTRELREKSAGMPPALDFAGALSAPGVRIIAEVKKASPSKGVIREDFDPVSIAKAYEANGAAAISVLTDEKYFQGSLEYLRMIRAGVRLPLLRKDFIISEYQVYESRAAGADAILLIAAVLDREELKDLLLYTDAAGLSALVEVHDEDELASSLDAGASIIGVNNRDLNTFRTNIETTARLAPMVPKERILVTESGINTPEDIARLSRAGARAFLVGESLMREEDPGAKLAELAGALETG